MLAGKDVMTDWDEKWASVGVGTSLDTNQRAPFPGTGKSWGLRRETGHVTYSRTRQCSSFRISYPLDKAM